GRQDDPGNAAGWDVSGGLVDGADLARRTDVAHNNLYNVEYQWQQDSDGRWGWTQTTTVGTYFDQPHDPSALNQSPFAQPAGSSNPQPSGNGKQISYTWVDEIRSYTGGPPPFDTQGNRTADLPAMPDVGQDITHYKNVLDGWGMTKPVARIFN